MDAVRGFAILTMLWGHLGIAIYHPVGRGHTGATLSGSPPLWAEVFGGVAPVFFVAVCGMMVAYGHARGRTGLRKQLLRMAALVSLGAFIDVVFWRIRPFTTVDILYSIGVCLPLCFLAMAGLPRWGRLLLALLILGMTPILQDLLGYADYPTELTLAGAPVMRVANQTSVLNHWLIDGWFPLAPWLGVAVLGTVIGERRLDSQRLLRTDWWLLGLAMVALAVALLLGWPNAAYRSVLRLNAGGAFMPPDYGYLLASLGALILVTACFERLPRRAAWPLLVLGRTPLFVYLSHFVVVKVLARLLGQRLSFAPAVGVLVVAMTILVVAALVWVRLRDEVARRFRAAVS